MDWQTVDDTRIKWRVIETNESRLGMGEPVKNHIFFILSLVKNEDKSTY